MPWGEPDPTDPNVLVGVELPAPEEATREMAWVVAEEFARMGFDAARILRLFRLPFYAGAHQALRALGEPEVAAIVAECVAVWGPRVTENRGAPRVSRGAPSAGGLGAMSGPPCPEGG